MFYDKIYFVKYSFVIDQLYQLCPKLKEMDDFVIAGGAVCNLIYNHIHNKTAPVNDIDVFLLSKEKESNLDGAVDSYRSQIIHSTYKILETSRDGILNFVKVESNQPNLFEFGNSLIESFDINACKAFIVFTNNERYVFTHREFEEFLLNKTIKVNSFKTAIKSVLRVMKKKEELDCFLDKSHILYSYQFSKNQKCLIVEENYHKFKKQIDSLIEDNYLKVSKTSRGLYFLKPIYPFIEMSKVEDKISRRFPDLFDKILILKTSNPKSYRKYLKISNFYKTTIHCLTFGLEEKTRLDFNDQNLYLVERTLQRIPEFWNKFKNLSLNEIIRVCIEIYSLEKKFGLDLCFEYGAYMASFDLKKNYNLKEQFLKEISDKSQNLVDPIKHSFNEIKELNSKKKLSLESNQMNHCVSGYWNRIGPNHRIFSIKSNQSNSTLEIVFKKNKWIGIQHRGKNNSFPCDLNRKIAIDFLNFLNNQ